MQPRIISEEQLRQKVHLSLENLKVIEAGFISLSQNKATMPPVMRIDIPEYRGEVDVKSAYIQDLDSFAIKLSSGFFNNHKLGLPSASGLMILVSSETGQPKALLLDNGYLTDIRTGLAGGIAAKYLAPKTVDTVGIVGSGAQARYQLEALALVRSFTQVLVYSRSTENTEQYCQTMEALLDISVKPAPDIKTLVQKSQVVVTTTPSKEPLIEPEWLHPGLHITAMGSDAEDKNEIAPLVFPELDLIVCDSLSQCLQLGELHHAQKAGTLANLSNPIIELGELCANTKAGRRNEQKITLCDLTGTGVQDTAIARKALELCG